ncbi:MAG: hypothetical protein ACYS9X_12045 [Planctomycetota bacterium]|jgi:hypothetical protein
MQRELGTRLLKMLLVLLLGNGAPDGEAPDGPDLRAFRPAGAPVRAEVDLARLRELVAGSPEIAKLVYEGKTRTAAVKEAAAFVGLAIGAEPARVEAAFANVRRAAVWLTAFGDRDYRFRVLAVIDTGGTPNVLEGLLAGAERFEGYHRTTYAGATLHGFAMGRGYGVWCAEVKGLVAIALDPLAVQGFLLRAADAEPERIPGDGGVALELDVDCRAFLDMLMLAMGSGDRDEFLAASALLDFPSWRWAGATYDGRRLEARLELDPRSPLIRALRQPAAPPPLMGAVPEDCGIALVAGLEDARAGWEFVKSAVAFATQLHQPGAGLDLAEELRRETGLDAVEDVFANLRAGALIVPKLERPRDIEERSILVFEVADGPAAEVAIEMLVAAIAKGEVDVRVERGATIWQRRNRRGRIAIKGTTVVVAPGRESPLEAVLEQLRRGQSEVARSLRDAHPSATAFATVDFAGLGAGGGLDEAGVLAGFGRRSVGLSFEDGVLRAAAEVRAPDVAKAVLGVAKAQRARMTRRECMTDLRRVYIAAYRYAAAKGGFPESIEQMREYLRGAKGACSATGDLLIYRPELAGRRARDFQDRANVVVAHDPPGSHPDGGNVVYLNGRVVWLPLERFAQLLAELDQPPPEEPGRPEPEPDPVF